MFLIGAERRGPCFKKCKRGGGSRVTSTVEGSIQSRAPRCSKSRTSASFSKNRAASFGARRPTSKRWMTSLSSSERIRRCIGGGGKRFGQDHPCKVHHGPHRSDFGLNQIQRRGSYKTPGAGTARLPAAGADDFPRPVRDAEPGEHRFRNSIRSDQASDGGNKSRGHQAKDFRTFSKRSGWILRRGGSLSAPAQRRTAPEDKHCPGPCD